MGKTKTSVVDLSHYMNYPVCGFCNTAWDVIYGRIRSGTSPLRWVEWCKAGGCDPDVWDFIDLETGWPVGWKIDHDVLPSMPRGYREGKHHLLKFPPTDNRVYHRRADSDKNAPWRKTTAKLRNEANALKVKKASLTIDDLFEDDENGESSANVPATTDTTWLDDDDLW